MLKPLIFAITKWKSGTKWAVLFVFVACLVSACAVPVPPTGGPPDQKPPQLVNSSPESGSTGFSGRVLEFEFDEAVDLRSFVRAFSITPDLSGPPLITGSGKRFQVRLPEDPRPETTYIVSLDATLRDVHSVVLTQPLTVAFSTGNQIDDSKMSGKVVRLLDGKALSGTDVFAFADNDSLTLSRTPLYRTQTGKTGEFLFEHVANRRYFVVAVQDGNRNRILDPGEPYGVPPVEFLQADTVTVSPHTPWVVSSRDTTSPRLERVRVISPTELELRYSEPLFTTINSYHLPVQTTSDQLSVTDSLGSLISSLALYITETGSRSVFAQTEPLEPGSYTLIGKSPVSDSTGNAALPARMPFEVPNGLMPSPEPEFMTWVPDSAVVNTTTPRTIWYQEMVGFRITAPIDTLVGAVLRDTSGTPYPAHFVQRESTMFELQKKGAFSFEAPFYLDINQKEWGGPDSLVSGLFRFATDREVGALSFVLYLQPNSAKPYVVSELFEAGNLTSPFTEWMSTGSETEFNGTPKSLSIERIPGGKRVYLRVFQNDGGTHKWRGGTLSPWVPADPVSWVEILEPIRSRWETALPDTLDFRSWPYLTSQ